jgi:hypothetical protein
MKVNDVCPYNKSHRNTGLVEDKSFRYFAVCPVCGKSARVVIYERVDGSKTCTLSKIGKRPVGDAKKVRSVRLSDVEMQAVADGRLRLVVSNNRITVTV